MITLKHLIVMTMAVACGLSAPNANRLGPMLRDVFADNSLADRGKPDFELGGSHLARRQDYNQNYKTSGNVNYQATSTGYSVTFSGAGDFVVGKGWRTGTTRCLSSVPP